MSCSRDPEVEALRRAKIRAATLERHFRARGRDGRSRLAVEAGRTGGRATVDRYPGGPRAWSARMNLARNAAVPFKWAKQGSEPLPGVTNAVNGGGEVGVANLVQRGSGEKVAAGAPEAACA